LTTNTSFELCRETSIYPRHYLLKRSDELLPPALGILLGLLLIFEVVEAALPEPAIWLVQSIRGSSAPSRPL